MIRFLRRCTLVLVSVLALPGCSDSPAEAHAKNEQYLDRLSTIVCNYHAKQGKLPESFEQALSASGSTLPHRGDYYGQPYQFLRFQDTAFCFRAGNVEVSYVNCKKVPHAAFVVWVQSHSTTDEWNVTRKVYEP